MRRTFRLLSDLGKPGTFDLCRGFLGIFLLFIASGSYAVTVYRWVDESGIVHLSSDKPSAGVHFERVEVASSSKRSPSSSSSTAKASGGSAPVSAAQAADRNEVLASLKNRECVVALETLDRKTSATEPTSAAEIRRLQQTVDANCSQDPSRRRNQEDMAARLRVANGPQCVRARNELGTMLEPGSKTPRDELRAQQAFVDQHCVAPVR